MRPAAFAVGLFFKRKRPGARPRLSQMRYTAQRGAFLISPLTWDSRIRVSPSFWAVSPTLSFRSRRGNPREPERLRPALRCR